MPSPRRFASKILHFITCREHKDVEFNFMCSLDGSRHYLVKCWQDEHERAKEVTVTRADMIMAWQLYQRLSLFWQGVITLVQSGQLGVATVSETQLTNITYKRDVSRWRQDLTEILFRNLGDQDEIVIDARRVNADLSMTEHVGKLDASTVNRVAKVTGTMLTVAVNVTRDALPFIFRPFDEPWLHHLLWDIGTIDITGELKPDPPSLDKSLYLPQQVRKPKDPKLEKIKFITGKVRTFFSRKPFPLEIYMPAYMDYFVTDEADIPQVTSCPAASSTDISRASIVVSCPSTLASGDSGHDFGSCSKLQVSLIIITDMDACDSEGSC